MKVINSLQKYLHPTKNSLKIEEIRSTSKVWWLCSEGHETQGRVNTFKRKGCSVCALRSDSLAVNNPELAKEWHTSKNGKLKPEEVSTGSHIVVWWKCKEHGHEWQAPINNRQKGFGCPYEAGKQVWQGNCFANKSSAIVNEWHPTRNGTLKPNQVTYGSGKKVWWVCAKGHEFQETVHHRSQGRACPVCFPKGIRRKGKP